MDVDSPSPSPSRLSPARHGRATGFPAFLEDTGGVGGGGGMTNSAASAPGNGGNGSSRRRQQQQQPQWAASSSSSPGSSSLSRRSPSPDASSTASSYFSGNGGGGGGGSTLSSNNEGGGLAAAQQHQQQGGVKKTFSGVCPTCGKFYERLSAHLARSKVCGTTPAGRAQLEAFAAMRKRSASAGKLAVARGDFPPVGGIAAAVVGSRRPKVGGGADSGAIEGPAGGGGKGSRRARERLSPCPVCTKSFQRISTHVQM